MSGGSADTGYVEEPSPIVLQPVCAVQTNVGGCSYGDSDSDDDLTLSSSDAAYRAAHGHLLRLNSGMNGGKQSLSTVSAHSITLEEEGAEEEEDDDEVHSRIGDFFTAPCRAAEQAEEFVKKVWEAGWRVVHHNSLPNWLKDNDFLHKGHRVPTNSFMACFKSIFRIHTETGNIWTHLLDLPVLHVDSKDSDQIVQMCGLILALFGFIAFIGIATYFVTRPSIEIQWQEKAVFSAFFLGAILCLGFSWVFHTVFNHSKRIGKLFNKLDYCGIAFLTMGSFVPWLYYSFYCRLGAKITYLALIFVLGTLCIVVSLWDKFSEPRFRALRAGVFIALGLSGVIPAFHFVITDGFWFAVDRASLGWLSLMAVLYIVGAVIYAVRIPERLFPGKFDIWSHQIFHVFVLAAAFVHYHGVSEIANYRLTLGDCLETQVF